MPSDSEKPSGSENFSGNIELLMWKLNLSQSQLADIADLKPTTINKWFVTNATPKQDNLEKICSAIKNKYGVEITTQLLLGNPYEFATVIKVPWHKVSPIVTKSRLPVRNLIFEKNDIELLNIAGFYNIFYPSVAYKGAFFAAALKIAREDEFFYFEIFNRSLENSDRDSKKRWKIDSLYQSGSVGRLGKAATSNAILIGDLVGEHGEDVVPSVQFTSLKIPRESRPSQLFGRAVALDFNSESPHYGYLLATPLVAVAKGNVPRDCDVRKIAPSKGYFDLDEMKQEHPDVLSALKRSPAPWCYKGVTFDENDE